LRFSSITLPSGIGSENEDAMVVGDNAAVVVDGAGLPRTMRAGCSHSVAWFARSIADDFHAALASRTGTISDALAEAIEQVAGSHSSTCNLDAGAPSATVAAWRRTGNRIEYLVLCDAALIFVDRDGYATIVTDRRLEHLVDAAMADAAQPHSGMSEAAARRAARARVESRRNRHGGFWCVNSDPAAAAQALTGVIELEDLTGLIACSDGATRAYDLLSSHTLDRFATESLRGPLDSLATAIRHAEDQQSDALVQRGFKAHDDLTIVAATIV
jgi:hypothetical protein